MSKRKYQIPVLLSGGFTPIDPGDGEDTGDGTGMGGQEPFPCTYDDWLNAFASDVNGDDEINEDDYMAWMEEHGWEP